MAEYIVPVDEELARELHRSFLGPPIGDDENLVEVRMMVGQIGGLKVEIFANEHPPPHFRVVYQGRSNDFSIADCEPMHGHGLKGYWRRIRKWHCDHKNDLINAWDTRRPSNCPVGPFKD